MLTEFSIMQRALIYVAGWLAIVALFWIASLIAEGKRK